MKPWHEFCKLKFYSEKGFFGCVDKDGVWFDSSEHFATALHWCCYHAGEFNLKSHQDEVIWFEQEATGLGYSIIHSDILRKMYESGLIR